MSFVTIFSLDKKMFFYIEIEIFIEQVDRFSEKDSENSDLEKITFTF